MHFEYIKNPMNVSNTDNESPYEHYLCLLEEEEEKEDVDAEMEEEKKEEEEEKDEEEDCLTCLMTCS